MAELLLLIGLAAGDETALTVRSISAVDVAADRAEEDVLETTTRLAASAKGGELTRWSLGVLAEHTLRVGTDTEAMLRIRADESGIDAPLGPFRVRAGYLVERWGKLDLLPVVDVINARDLRHGLLTPSQHLRLPAGMVRLQYGSGSARAELTWLPVPPRDVGSILETDWSILRQGWLTELASEAATWEGDALTESSLQDGLSMLSAGLSDLDGWTTSGLSQLSSTAGLPQATGAGSDVFLRIEADGPGIDGALLGGVMTVRQPALQLEESLLVYLKEQRLPGYSEQEALLEALSEPVDQLTPRTLIAGAELGTLVGPVGVRAEGLWTAETAVSRDWFQAATAPAIAAGAGLDWARGTMIFTAEGSWRRLLNAPADPWLTQADHIQFGGGMVARVLAERMTVQLGGLYDLTFSEHLLQSALSWRASDRIELTAGVLLLGGSEAAPSSLLEAASYAGGPMGYWGDNDCFTIEMAYIR